jgi:hypothetical protein
MKRKRWWIGSEFGTYFENIFFVKWWNFRCHQNRAKIDD